MPKTIICVYQDCVMCGDRGKKLKTYIATHGLDVRKVSFASEDGSKLVKEAVFNHKIGTMPFFTDGKKFTTNIKDFVKVKKSVKRTRKARKDTKEDKKNGAD